MVRGNAQLSERPNSISEVRLERMQAMILAGGKGTRLRPMVNDRPKAMASVGEKPFLELQIECLKKYGVANFIFCVGHLHQHIQNYFGDGRNWGVRIEYSIEKDLLGTGGALKHAERYLRGSFLAFNGDSYLDLDLRKLIQFHEYKKATNGRCLGSIVLTKVPEAHAFGSVQIDQGNRILTFDEKAEGKDAPPQVNAGIYVLEPDILNCIPAATEVSLERETFPSVLKMGFHLYGYLTEGFFADIGTPHGYCRFQDYIKQRPQ